MYKKSKVQKNDYTQAFLLECHSVGAGGVSCIHSTGPNTMSVKRSKQFANRMFRKIGMP